MSNTVKAPVVRLQELLNSKGLQELYLLLLKVLDISPALLVLTA